MKIKLSDVGRVKHAEAVLEGITVVAGNNGSGKSTISKSLYTVLEASYDLQGKNKRNEIVEDYINADYFAKMTENEIVS